MYGTDNIRVYSVLHFILAFTVLLSFPSFSFSHSDFGLLQETNHVSFPLSAAALVLFRSYQETFSPAGAALPKSEGSLQTTAKFKCFRLILIQNLVSVFVLQVCENLWEMCVVLAGPFPAGFSETEVKRLFRCCGPVRRVKMLNTAVRVCLPSLPSISKI